MNTIQSDPEEGSATLHPASNAKKRGRIDKMKRAKSWPVNTKTQVATYNENHGLYLADLERRWVTAKPLTRSMLEAANLPWGGRRANVLYSWRSIFIVEGMSDLAAVEATPESYPDLYKDLLCTQMAADKLFDMLGQYRTSASVRKLIGNGIIPTSSYIQIGRRQMYRLRPLAFETVCKTLLRGRLV
jgi:hypothetical protein